jgi:hypothetical protein
MALKIQRGACYPDLLIAGAILWILSLSLLAAIPFVQGSTKAWVSRACKGSAVIASVSIVVASVATTASAYALVQYTSPATSWITSGRMGVILAVQWAAAGAMSMHALLAFAVAGGGKDDSDGFISLED